MSNCVTHKACHIKPVKLFLGASHKECHSVLSTQRVTPGIEEAAALAAEVVVDLPN